MLACVASSGAQAALKGYRLQALYALSRLLDGNDGHVFQPEGGEDLAVFGATGELLEATQVKAHEHNLTLSSFKPRNKDSFFRRVLERQAVHRNTRERIVSFGPFGPQMTSAWSRDGRERTEAVSYFVDAGYTEAEARTILSVVELEVLDPVTLETSVLERLRDTLAGVDSTTAFDLLHAWIFAASETQQRLKPAGMREKIVAIGRFVHERAAHHDEWFRSIVPLSAKADPTRYETLREEFSSGISARYEHITAGLDVLRANALLAVDEAFAASRLVVIHGASGQGKTALAYRYLHDFVPETWRFDIRLVESPLHALNVARALLGHLSAIGAPAYVYIDVGPGESAWLNLVRALADYPLVRILVTIREEDWNRASSPGGTLLPARDIVLSFDESEARAIYDQLVAYKAPDHVLSFDDAWARFGGQGPLLEFAHFVARNETLEQRLSNQIARLRDDRRADSGLADEIELLRRVAVVTAYGARLYVGRVATGLHLPDPARSIALFEREFLVRVAPGGRLLEALHPIRSQILARLLVDDVFDPWSAVVARSLAAVFDPDLEMFLLTALSRHPLDSGAIVAAIGAFVARTWTAAGGILRTLLWLGVRDYLRQNEPLIREVQAVFGSGWFLILVADVGNLNAVAPGLMEPLFERLSWFPEDWRGELAALRSRLTATDEVLAGARRWLGQVGSRPEEPTDVADWSAIAEVAFWLRHLGVAGTLADALPTGGFPLAAETLPLEVATDVAFGLSFTDTEASRAALRGVRPALLARFQRETGTPAIEDDGRVIRAHFVVDMTIFARRAGSRKRANVVHSEAMRRVELLRQIVPDREGFGCQGYGHKLDALPVDGDDSTKTAIPAGMLPPRWPQRLNMTFIRLGTYVFRPDHWSTHAEAVMTKRRRNLDGLQLLVRVLELYFADSRHADIIGTWFSAEHWQDSASAIKQIVPFPRDAVDEWGQTTEGDGSNNEEATAVVLSEIVPALERHESYRRAYSAFFSPLSNFYEQVVDAIAVTPFLARSANGTARKALREKMVAQGLNADPGRLPTLNLFNAMNELAAFQAEFRARFARYFPNDELSRVEESEGVLVRRMFATWYQFVYHPERILARAAADAERRMQGAASEVMRRLRGRFAKLRSQGVHASIRREREPWERKPALWITVDVTDPQALFDAYATVYDAIATSLPSTLPYDLPRYATLDSWDTVHVLPLVRGRLYRKASWRFSALAVARRKNGASEATPWMHTALQDLPPEVLEVFQIPHLDVPSLEPIHRLVATTTAIVLLIGSIVSFGDMPEPNAVGNEVLRAESSVRSAQLAALVKEMNGALSDILRFLQRELDSSDNGDVPGAVRVMAKTFSDTAGTWLPQTDADGHVVIGIEEMRAWSESLSGALGILQRAELFWLAHILPLGERHG